MNRVVKLYAAYWKAKEAHDAALGKLLEGLTSQLAAHKNDPFKASQLLAAMLQENPDDVLQRLMDTVPDQEETPRKKTKTVKKPKQ